MYVLGLLFVHCNSATYSIIQHSAKDFTTIPQYISAVTTVQANYTLEKAPFDNSNIIFQALVD